MKTSRDVAFVIASCDKYSDLWTIVFGQLFKHWPNIPFPVYLIANHKKFHHPKVTTLLAGDDLDWSSTVLKSIEQVEESRILFWIDDAFLVKDVDGERISFLVNYFVKENFNFLRMRPDPSPGTWRDDGFGVLDVGQPYRVSLFSTLWEVSVLKQLIKPGESAWEFEVNGTQRSHRFDNFYCTKNQEFTYLHGIERGIWLLPAVRELRRQGYKIDSSERPIMNFVEDLGARYRSFKSWVFNKLPESRRASVMEVVRKMYQILGLR